MMTRERRRAARARRITALLSAMFGASACVKLLAPHVYAEAWPAMGIPLGFVTVVGVLELVGALALWARRFAALVAVTLALLMAIALGLTATHGRWGEATLSCATLVLTLWCARLRWPEFDPLPPGT